MRRPTCLIFGLFVVGCGGAPPLGPDATTASTSGDSSTNSGRDDGVPADTDGGSPSGGNPDSASPGAIDLGTIVTPAKPGAADIQIEVHADSDQLAISPLIYGYNSDADIANSKFTMVRLGGNRWTAYNWENNASNAGSDYLYENDGALEASNTPGKAISDVLTVTAANNAATVVTIPIVDYVAADKDGGGDIRKTPNYMTTRLKQSRANKGSALSLTPDTTDAYVNEDELVNWLNTTYGKQQIIYQMDNEPDLWSSTHPEVHPTAVGYDELCTRSVTNATMVKSLVPKAEVAGPVSYGWTGYVNLQNAPDNAGKGEFIDYYLAKMAAASTTAGHRLLDYLDLHWYPEATGGGERITGTQTDAAIVAARVQAPRSLWDPTYKETSWIESSLNGAIELIPLMHGKIAKSYPGTKLSITEWNYGAGADISGAVASADVLGIFGRYGVAMASNWPLQNSEPYTLAAYRAFRNYDGAGAAFGSTSVLATTSDVVSSSVYGSIDSSKPNRMVIVAINKTTSTKTASVTLFAATTYSKLNVFTVTSAAAAVKAQADVANTGTNVFMYAMPAMSISVLVPQP